MNSTRPAGNPSPRARVRRATGLALAASALLLAAVARFGVGWLPPCPFYALTGLRCPGCGAGRALFALLQGDLRLAWQQNALFVALLPLLAAAAVAWCRRRLRETPLAPPAFPSRLPPLALAGLLACVALFTLARNLP